MSSSLQRTLDRVPGRSWYALAILTLVYAINYFDRTILGIVIEPLKREFNLSDSQLGFLTGMAFSLPYVVSSIPLGMLADRINRRNLLAGVLFFWSVLTAVCGLTHSYLTLVAARCAVGAAESGAGPTSMSLIGDFFSVRRRSLALSIFWVSVPVGMSVCFILGGSLAASYGWRAAFFLAGGIGLGLFLLLLTVQEPTRGALEPAVPTTPKSSSIIEAWNSVRRQPAVLNVLIGMILISIVNSGVSVWLPVFLIREDGLPLRTAGLIAGTAAGVCGIVGTPLVGYLADRVTTRFGVGRLPVISALNSLFVVSGAAILSVASPHFAWLGLLLFYTFYISYTGPSYGFVVSHTDPRFRALTMAAVQTGTNLVGWGVGPIIVGTVSDAVGGPHSLRYGILTVLIFGIWSITHSLIALRLASRASVSRPTLTAA